MFSFLILKRLKELDADSDIDPHLFKFFLTGVVSTPPNLREKPNVEWLT